MKPIRRWFRAALAAGLLAALSPARTEAARLFPPDELFRPPLANPREPRTHMTWLRVELPVDTFNVGSVGFGESFGLVRWESWDGVALWQLGISGGVLAQFNLDASSLDLVNADYLIGFPFSVRSGPWSGRLRVYHQSSHLGDEFLLLPQRFGPVERINLSFEAVELFAGAQWKGLALAAGPSYIFHSDTPLERWKLQGELSFEGGRLGWGTARPVAGIFAHLWEETDWDVDVSVKAGVSFESPYAGNRAVQILLEYFDGHIPWGQFYEIDAEYWGVGVNFVF